jgi:hypothetical protein
MPTAVGEATLDSQVNGDGVAPAAAEPDETSPPSSGAAVLLVDYAGDERGMGALLALLVANDVVVTRFAEQASDLEDIFMQVTKGIVQ